MKKFFLGLSVALVLLALGADAQVTGLRSHNHSSAGRGGATLAPASISATGLITTTGSITSSESITATGTIAGTTLLVNGSTLTPLSGNYTIGGAIVSVGSSALTGTEVDITGIASANKVIINVSGASLDSSSLLNVLALRLGHASGFDTTGYTTTAGNGASAFATDTVQFLLTTDIPSTSGITGQIILTHWPVNFWCVSGSLADPSDSKLHSSAGCVQMGGQLTRIRFRSGSTGSFDSGSIQVSYER